MINKIIGVLTLSLCGSDKSGFYNDQHIGLIKSLGFYFKKVIGYKTTKKIKTVHSDIISENITNYCLPSFSIGQNGFFNLKYLDKKIDILICFSDTQIFFTHISLWSKKNHIILIPYIGAIYSNCNHFFHKFISLPVVKRNLGIYKKSICFAKTPFVMEKLKRMGVKNVFLIPVGLDTELLKKDWSSFDSNQFKEENGFSKNSKVLLFVGRLVDEKHPLDAIDIFKQIYCTDSEWRMIIIGQGPLLGKIENQISKYDLGKQIKIITSVPNSKMWMFYVSSNFFLNLNHNEIFGMSILESLYYGCKVIAYSAPGPDFILQHNNFGFILKKEEIPLFILSSPYNIINTHSWIENNFTWKSSAKKIIDVLLFLKIIEM